MLRMLVISLMMLLGCSGLCLAGAATEDIGAQAEKEKASFQFPHEHTAKCEATAAEPVQIVCILDRSGSMQNLAGDTIGGYNSFLAKQRQEAGAAEVTTVLFDDRYDKIVDSVPLKKVPKLTSKEYYARGMTALLDAVGRTIVEKVGAMDKAGVCPAKRRVLFLIMTDGQENDSKEYTRDTVKAMIETATEKYGWNFIFMGANIDSVAEAGSIGIRAEHAVDYAYDAQGVKKSFDRMSAAASEMRTTGEVGESWKNGR